jgi:tetratricopeptide (TPR) repeat protein
VATGETGSGASGWRKGDGGNPPAADGGGAAAPDNIEQRCDRAVELKNRGQYDEAAAEFQEILNLCPGHARAHLGLGLVLCFVGRFEESLEELKRAVECDASWVDGHLNLAKTYAMLGMYDEAKVEFNRVLELHPGHPEATKQLKYFEDLG